MMKSVNIVKVKKQGKRPRKPETTRLFSASSWEYKTIPNWLERRLLSLLHFHDKHTRELLLLPACQPIHNKPLAKYSISISSHSRQISEFENKEVWLKFPLTSTRQARQKFFLPRHDEEFLGKAPRWTSAANCLNPTWAVWACPSRQRRPFPRSQCRSGSARGWWQTSNGRKHRSESAWWGCHSCQASLELVCASMTQRAPGKCNVVMSVLLLKVHFEISYSRWNVSPLECRIKQTTKIDYFQAK